MLTFVVAAAFAQSVPAASPATEETTRLLAQVEPRIKAIYETNEFDFSAIPKRAVLVPGDPTYRTFEETRVERIGGPITTLRIGVVGVEGGPTRWIELPDEPGTFYLNPLGWAIIERGQVDVKNGWYYYYASPANATQRYLYRAHLDGTGTPERLTPADQPGTHQYVLSPDSQWASHTYSTFDAPPVIDLVQLPEHRSVRTLEDNAAAAARVKPLIARPTEFLQLDIGGGSNTLNALFRKPDAYHVGIAVVPKPQPQYYWASYQEIYMRTPKDNPENYRTCAPITYAEGLRGDLLIVVGTGETNTHVEITEGLVDRLIELGKRFDWIDSRFFRA